MFAELFHSTVIGVDCAVGAGEHDTAFHGDESERCEGVDVGAARERGLHFEEAFANGFDPALEVLSDEFVRRGVFWIHLESETTKRAPEGAVRHENAFAVAGEDGEDALEWFGRGGEGRIDYHGAEQLDVLLEDGAEEGLLAVEEVVEAA